MRLELVERLICPGAHARTPMIVVARRTRGRDLLDADLGCMTCHRQAMMLEGHVMLLRAFASDGFLVDDEDPRAALSRLEAQLGLAEPGARVLLAGRYARMADELARSTDALVVALNAATAPAEGVGSVFLNEPVVPFSDATFTAAAFTEEISAPQLHDALRTLQRGARVVGAWPLEVPAGLRLIARDDVEWVAERDALPGDVVPLRRR